MAATARSARSSGSTSAAARRATRSISSARSPRRWTRASRCASGLGARRAPGSTRAPWISLGCSRCPRDTPSPISGPPRGPGLGDLHPQGSPPLRSLAGLAGKEVLLQKDGLAEDEIRRLGIPAKLFPTETEREAIVSLASGNHDCAVTTQFGGRYAIRQERLDSVASSSPLLLKSPVAFAVKKGNADLLWLLEEGLVRVKASGRFNEIYDHWFRELDRPALAASTVLAVFFGSSSRSWGPSRLSIYGVEFSRARWPRARARLHEELAERRRAEAALREASSGFTSPSKVGTSWCSTRIATSVILGFIIPTRRSRPRRSLGRPTRRSSRRACGTRSWP